MKNLKIKQLEKEKVESENLQQQKGVIHLKETESMNQWAYNIGEEKPVIRVGKSKVIGLTATTDVPSYSLPYPRTTFLSRLVPCAGLNS
ncbi:unnamed protein product [Sphenostylis stenocarpa]|uniref:Uncharacterized protein n=1 Tax=Sphenostylis stenocarpa TaxID=92480 RepID=A0AA86RYY7_9FABA|nr:unnamed protein product [Sphenostylis stenocarpa]